MNNKKIMSGVVYVDIDNIIEQGQKLVSDRQDNILTMRDFNEVSARLRFGKIISHIADDKLTCNAYHEAGHALITALYLEKTIMIDYVTVVPRTRIEGFGVNLIVFSLVLEGSLIEENALESFKMSAMCLFAGGIAGQYAFRGKENLGERDLDRFLLLPGVGFDFKGIKYLVQQIAVLAKRFEAKDSEQLKLWADA